MLYWLTQFSDRISVLNVFRYITFRTGGAMMTALVMVFLFGPLIINGLRLMQGKGQPIREDGPASHLVSKRGTPTMGGLMILFGLVISTLLWGNLTNRYVWIVLGVTLGFGFIGIYNDNLKVTRRSHGGFADLPLALEATIAGLACYAMAQIGRAPLSTSLTFPLFGELIVDLGFFFVIFGMFIIVATGNVVSLADRLDRLSISPVMIAAMSFAAIAYLIGNAMTADYLQIHFVAGAGELAVLCGAVLGAALGFLWFNVPLVSISMGNTASLALGGLIGTVAVATKHEVVLAIIGGLFMLEKRVRAA